MDPKFFKSMARLQKRIARLYDQDFIDISYRGVQVTDEKIVELAQFGELKVSEWDGQEGWMRGEVVIEGVTYYTVGSERDFVKAGVCQVCFFDPTQDADDDVFEYLSEDGEIWS
jgi:hypothetical protein